MLLMIAAPFCCESYEKVQLTAAADLIISLKNYFRNDCVFLLLTGHQRETSKYSFITSLFLQTDCFLTTWCVCDEGLVYLQFKFQWKVSHVTKTKLENHVFSSKKRDTGEVQIVREII